MARRHGWEVDPATILTTHGLVAAVGFCLQAFSAPGEGVILFTPVYHAFARVIRANGRRIVESPLALEDGRYRDGPRRAGRGADRGRAHRGVLLAAQPRRHGLERRRSSGRWRRSAPRTTCCWSPTRSTTTWCCRRRRPRADGGRGARGADRLVMLTATTKTFNIAGALTGNAIVADAGLRERLAGRIAAAGGGPNRFGVLMATAAYAARRRLGRRARRLSRRERADLRRGRGGDPRGAVDAAGGDLSRLGRLRRDRHDRRRDRRPGRARSPASPRAPARSSARAARAGCASTSARRARGSPRRWRGCRTAFADLQ